MWSSLQLGLLLGLLGYLLVGLAGPGPLPLLSFEAPAPLTQKFPVVGSMATSRGNMTVPFHMVSGRQTVVCGSLDPAAAERMLRRGHADQSYQPLLVDGRAVGLVYVQDYQRTTCGAYQELVFSLLVTRRDQPALRLGAKTPAEFALLLLHPGVSSYLDDLYLDSPDAIAYGRDLLSLRKDVRPMESSFVTDASGTLTVRAALAGQALFGLTLSPRPGALGRALGMGSLARSMAPWQAVDMLSQSRAGAWVSMVAPGGVIPGRPLRPSHLVSVFTGMPLLQPWDPAADRLELGPAFGSAAQHEFTPVVVQRLDDGQFVMFPPYDS